MAQLLDSSVWLGLLRRGSPKAVKELVSPWIVDDQSVLAEPVVFELLRFASDDEARAFDEYAGSVQALPSPASLWESAAKLGQACRRKGYSVKAIDLLIATVALEHEIEIVTFDGDYASIAKASKLKVRLLKI
jgi:predicted nucleic acid-binding protein